MPLGLRLETAFGEPRGSFVLFVLCAPAAHRPVSAWSGAGILLTDRVKKADAPVVAYRGGALERNTATYAGSALRGSSCNEPVLCASGNPDGCDDARPYGGDHDVSDGPFCGA